MNWFTTIIKLRYLAGYLYFFVYLTRSKPTVNKVLIIITQDNILLIWAVSEILGLYDR